MSIYIVQGPQSPWLLGEGEGEAHPAGPLRLRAPVLPTRPKGPTSGFHFLLRRENEASQ